MEKICTFCGHSDTPPCIRSRLKKTIVSLICEEGVQVFYIGNHGAFDRMALGVLQELHTSFTDIRYYIVLAYMPKNTASQISGVPTIFPEGLETVPRRVAIPRRNRWLVEHADFMISYVKRDFGGAARTLDYARNRQLRVINLGQEEHG